MTPAQKIKREILLDAQLCEESLDFLKEIPITEDNVDDLYNDLVRTGYHHECEEEVRRGHCKTGLPSPTSRHYESESVAAQMTDGSWVGWTRWFGGGKHGEPGSIDWMSDAYDLEVTEEEKLVVVRSFKRVT